jgi:hypothetical protein
MKSGIDRLNSVYDSYGKEASIILFVNAWELLSKAILLKKKKAIKGPQKNTTISAEQALHKLTTFNYFDPIAEDHVQQIISIRNEIMHSVPAMTIPDEILFHLMFFGVKSFKDLIAKNFPAHSKDLSKNFLSISFNSFTTYADKVQKLLSKGKKRGSPENHLVWLLERGVRYEGGKYISQDEFQKQMQRSRPLSHLKLGEFIQTTDMVVVVPVQAPKGFSADIHLSKGSKKSKTALPVMIKKTNLQEDFPFTTKDLSEKLGKDLTFIAKTTKNLGMKGNEKYHLLVRTGKSNVHRYSQQALDEIQAHLKINPSYRPYK